MGRSKKKKMSVSQSSQDNNNALASGGKTKQPAATPPPTGSNQAEEGVNWEAASGTAARAAHTREVAEDRRTLRRRGFSAQGDEDNDPQGSASGSSSLDLANNLPDRMNPVQQYIISALQQCEDTGEAISPNLMTLAIGAAGGHQRDLLHVDIQQQQQQQQVN